MLISRGDLGQDIVSHAPLSELLAQRHLVELAGRGVGQFFNEQDLVGQPPFRDMLRQVRQDIGGGDDAPGLADHQ